MEDDSTSRVMEKLRCIENQFVAGELWGTVMESIKEMKTLLGEQKRSE
jgi:hypothetical protein